MTSFFFVRGSLIALYLVILPTGAFAQQRPANEAYQPQPGQPGKDVIWVPTPEALVEKMLDVARVAPNDYVIDLGSGDGRTVISAAKRGARALGIEYNPDMVELSQRNAAAAEVGDRATFIKADLFESDLSQATVITLFLLPEINLKLRPKILGLKPGTRIVSNTFTMGAWTADRIVTVDDDCQNYCTAYFWIVPAKVNGTWQLSRGELTVKQNFQMLSGTLNSDGTTISITNGRLQGNWISFAAGDTEYDGFVSGNSMKGLAKSPRGTSKWSATASGR